MRISETRFRNTRTLRGKIRMFNNSVWVIKKRRAFIPEGPFEVLINGESMGRTKLLAFAKRVPNTDCFPQVLVLYSSGYLRLKAGADPTPPLPFGQSLVLGPAISGTSTSFPRRTAFFHPQLQRVAIDTSQLNQEGTGRMLIRITSSPLKFSTQQRNNQSDHESCLGTDPGRAA